LMRGIWGVLLGYVFVVVSGQPGSSEVFMVPGYSQQQYRHRSGCLFVTKGVRNSSTTTSLMC
jgi:hypothetical protein